MSICVHPSDRRLDKGEITRIICPDCGERVRNVVLLKNSHVDGLEFRCHRCGAFMSVSTDNK